MRSLITYLPAIACGAMMPLICVPMMFGRKHGHSSHQGASRQEVAELREEIARLKAEQALENETETL